MRLNKVNLCWVLSEGRKGHEIQSMTLAQHLAHDCSLHTFSLRQPWESFTPRIIPGFQNGFNWQSEKPNFDHPPDIIISTGRKAAAVGKYITQRYRKQSTQLKHIQILNPKDNADNYALLLIPEHDQKIGPNIITFVGSIHPFSPQWFSQEVHPPSNQINPIAVIIGNPPIQYFRQGFKTELQQIRVQYPEQPIELCGSPRLSEKIVDEIKPLLNPNDTFWFNHDDGPNPYQTLLQQAKHLFVTADSINMMNECAGSDVPVTLLATNCIQNPKHKRFIDSLANRWQSFIRHTAESIVPIPYALDEIINDVNFQKLLKYPSSSNHG
ncbi:hypothetical protein MNBD_GAMMA02-438 [hydrothermal vent metagenome]|uniref:DUF1022 domain-containing protein n=1 Tax=hydrothermal vent metagenome TaxID=652676 RepID=A0A3B0W505_9ZZZZ